MGFIKYGGSDPDTREEEVAAEVEPDMETAGGAEEKTLDSDDEEGAGGCPFPVAGGLSSSEPAEGNMVCRSARVCPGA